MFFSAGGVRKKRAELHRFHVCYFVRLYTFKAAWSVHFDLLILEIKFLFFKNTAKNLSSGIYLTNFVNLNKLSVSKQQHL